VHQVQPGVVTLSNASELGAVYAPEAVRALADEAHALGYRLHVDGSRFANAVASAGCAPRDLAGAAGVDALSFGGTKNGLAYGEAVLFFPQPASPGWFDRAVRAFPFHRKSTGHLLSKQRFVTAPFAATLDTGAWLRHAATANRQAQRLDRGLRALGCDLPHRTDANAVFVRLPPAVDTYLQARGHGYYPFGDDGLVRLMCSFDTTETVVDALVADVRRALEGS
jgi:threonine aldolase